MKIGIRSRGKLIAGTMVAAAALALPASALAASASPARHNPPATRDAGCTFQMTKVWLGIGNGTSTATTIRYALEFSNVGRFTCSLVGFPGVSGAGKNGAQVSPAAVRVGGKFSAVLSRGQTAYAILKVVSAGSTPGCNKVPGARFRVIAPNQTGVTVINGFTFTACSNKVTLLVSSVHFGTGIPQFNV
jgi:hypothetical protein